MDVQIHDGPPPSEYEHLFGLAQKTPKGKALVIRSSQATAAMYRMMQEDAEARGIRFRKERGRALLWAW